MCCFEGSRLHTAQGGERQHTAVNGGKRADARQQNVGRAAGLTERHGGLQRGEHSSSRSEEWLYAWR